MKKTAVGDVDVAGKRLLVRVDFGVHRLGAVASLEFLEGRALPGVAVVQECQP